MNLNVGLLLMNIYPKTRLAVAQVKRFIIIFYLIGIIGFLIPFTREIFITITPLALIVSSYLLIVYHNTYFKSNVLLFLLIFLLGFWAEVIGVNTGYIFGQYCYGGALGIKLLNVPLMIGVNWLFLTYTSMSAVKSIFDNEYLVVFFAPMLMVIYDLTLEQVAPKLDMWYWRSLMIPLRNYLAWYLIGLVFVTLFKFVRVDVKNPVAPLLFLCQFLFFLILTLLFD